MIKQMRTKNQEENFIFDSLLNLDDENFYFKTGEYCGEMDNTGEILNVIKGSYIGKDNDDTFRICVKGKYGIIDSNLRYLVEPQYDNIENALPFYEDYDDNERLQYIAEKDGKLGIINRCGDVLADFIYDNISDDFYIKDYTYHVTINDKHGLFNTEDGILIPVIYDSLMSAYDSYYTAEHNGKNGIIDKNNNVIIDFEYDFLAHISGTDLYRARIGDKYGIIKNTGEILNFNKENVIKIYDEIKSGKRNLNSTREKEEIIPEKTTNLEEKPMNLKEFVKDKKLKMIRYMHGFNYLEYGCICFNDNSGESPKRTCLIIDKDLNITFYDETVSLIIGNMFTNNFCIERNGLKGVIDAYGNEVIPCRYEKINIQVYHPSISPVKDAPFVVTKNNRQALYNNLLGEKISKWYDSIDTSEMGSISESFVVKENDLYGVINNSGDEIFMKKCDKLFFTTSEILFFKIDSAYGIMDINGEIYAEAKYKSVDILAGKYIIAENFDGTIEIVEI